MLSVRESTSFPFDKTDSGMKEDLSLYGNELNYANAIWSAAYVFGQIPSNLLLTRVGSR